MSDLFTQECDNRVNECDRMRPGAVIAKPRIIDDIGERMLLVPDAIARALAANDRVKYFFALLQLAQEHAACPDHALPSRSWRARHRIESRV